MRKIVLLLLVNLLSISTYSSELFNSLQAKFDNQLLQYPQEKVYVHTDRNCYMGGDTIWFRAYVVDALTHKPAGVSKYLYVDLTTPDDSLRHRVKILEREGVYSGYIPLDVTMPEANYTMTAYTYFMQNMGEDYYCKQPIRILNPLSTINTIKVSYKDKGDKVGVSMNYVDKSTGKHAEVKNVYYVSPKGRKTTVNCTGELSVNFNKKDFKPGAAFEVGFDGYRKFIELPVATDDANVEFFPEGGAIVAGCVNKIGVKSLLPNGYGKEINGEIVDSRDSVITKFHTIHAGMGFFTLLAKSGESYTAICNVDNKTMRLPLPKVEDDALALTLAKCCHQISIRVNGRINDEYTLVVHQRGNLMYATTINRDKQEVNLLSRDISRGVVNVVLFDKSWNPVSERLFFEKGDNRGKVKISANKRNYESRERVKLNIELSKYKMPEGNYSIAVTDDKLVAVDTAKCISSNLLLTSELKGNIEDASFYFNFDNANSVNALDALMLTQGWRRYDVANIVKGNYDQPEKEVEIGQEISGITRSKWGNRLLSGGLVNAIVPKYGYADIFQADSVGHFRCNGFDFPEGTIVTLQSINAKKDHLFPNFVIDPEELPMRMRHLNAMTAKFESEDFVNSEKLRFQQSGMEVVLNEIIVTALKKRAPEDSYEAIAFRSFNWKEMEREKTTTVAEILRKVGGLQLTNDGNYVYRGQLVSLYIDGLPQNESSISIDAGFDKERPTGGSFVKSMMEHRRINKSTAHLKPQFGGKTESTLDIIERVPFDFVKRVDFIRPSEAVMLGERGTSGGVIMITTKRGDELNTASETRFRTLIPLGYQRKADFYVPRYSAESETTVMDLRPTIYWNPNVKMSEKGKSNVEFFTSDSMTDSYSVRVEGLTDAGVPFSQHIQLEKKN